MAAFESLKEHLPLELESELRKLVGVWFPRSIDREHGGFLCDFDYRWKPLGPQLKMLEYQARQTIAAARSAGHFTDLAYLREAASHGFRYLKEQMWDRTLGGWFRLLDRTGKPLEGATKHGHGSSYAISACIACYELTRDPECLELAKTAFAWLEKHAHDNEHGGYFVFYRQDGSPILALEQGETPGKPRDAIGTPIGFKDANTTSDLLKAFSDLYRVWPDTLLRKRLGEILAALRDRLVVAPGVMHMYAHADWTPLPDFVRYGQVLRSAVQLLSASQALTGAADPVTARVAGSMVDTMLRVAWDRHRGGFHLAGSSFGPTYVENTLIFERYKCWWPQADGMRALLTMARLHPTGADEYARRFTALWDYVKTYVIDRKRGGWLAAGLDTNPESKMWAKATIWKDASHETDALLDSILMLRES
jgi:mannobiose 2-epimerase